ncbi:hypothetical protein MEQ_06072, partial [Candida albicans P87]
DRFQVTLMDDLFENKQSIFNELRRQSSTRSAVASVSPSVSRNSSLTRSESIKSNKGHNAAAITKSKSRLESRLQSAVKNQTKTSEPQQKTDADEFYDAEASPTPSRSGTQSSSSGLKRSNSPKKKKWTVVPKEESKEGNEKSKKITSTPVTYRPSNDIIYDKSPSNQSLNDLSSTPPPKFAPSLGRKSSVKDLAKSFENGSTEDLQEPSSRSRSSSPTKAK